MKVIDTNNLVGKKIMLHIEIDKKDSKYNNITYYKEFAGEQNKMSYTPSENNKQESASDFIDDDPF